MDPIREHIKNQLTYNDGKNLLGLEFGSDFSFIDGTDSMVVRLAGVKPEEREKLIDFAAARAIEAFFSINQYYSFDAKAKNELKEIYRRLFEWLLEKPSDLTLTAGLHYRNGLPGGGFGAQKSINLRNPKIAYRKSTSFAFPNLGRNWA